MICSLAASPAGTLAVAAVVAAACGLLVHRHGFVVLAAVGSTLAVGLGWPWAAVAGVRAGAAFEADRGTAGVAVECRVSVRNRGPVPAAGLILRGLSDDPIPLPPVRPFGSAEVRVAFVPARRGAYPSSAAAVTCGLPFGLWHPGQAVTVERPMLVWPAAEATPLPGELHGRRAATVEAAVAARLAGDAESHGVRPYRRGDPLKAVHHAQTARHDRLIVRERADAGRPGVRVVLDSAESSYDGPAARERSIQVAAGLLAACAAAGVDADAVVEGRIVRAGRAALDALARVGSPGGPPARALVASTASRGGRAVVLVTSTTASVGRPFAGSVVSIGAVA